MKIESPAGCAILGTPMALFGGALVAGSLYGPEKAWIGAVAPIIGLVAVGFVATLRSLIKK